MSADFFFLLNLTDLIRHFSVIFVSVLNILTDNFGDNESLLPFILNLVGNPSFLSILGARLLFNMKEAGEKGLNQGTSCGSNSTISEIDFADAAQARTEHSQEAAAQGEEIVMVEFV